ncbi:YciE/YciF ferroxidase family protein [Granulibacter bethesdensis]|uniref:YciE/YciF ferroxidase family protein n=1 Tax=Granulibacter bethesdensis TaxID=364410 RepID=UPI0003F1DC63|nr:ferritin-like domain-containing protein [Granulibacter bethesdensis]AHJ67077.1 Protein yciF [Granulibacter bethesdensis]
MPARNFAWTVLLGVAGPVSIGWENSGDTGRIGPCNDLNRKSEMEKIMPTKEKTLSDAFYETLKDIYFAEKQIVKALKKSEQVAQEPELRNAFETHRSESMQQIERLNQIFELIGKSPRAKTCEAMQGILAEMEEDLEEFGGSNSSDAVLIGTAQAIEHYEITRYGTLKTWAANLGLSEAEELLDETLQEEKRTDALLTEIANKLSNQRANSQTTK